VQQLGINDVGYGLRKRLAKREPYKAVSLLGDVLSRRVS
jgi:hypothetical protein